MKKILSFFLALILVCSTLPAVGDVLIEKQNNRYYMLQEELDRLDETYEVQVYGSCHAYTSYNPTYMVEKYNVSSYVFATPGEIFPSTYVRMANRFKTDVPKVALVEIWGANPYETYDSTSNILSGYFPACMDMLPFSMEKLEVICDFEELDLFNESIAVVKYKNRLAKGQLKQVDFDHDYLNTYGMDWTAGEMTNRFDNYGYKSNPSVPLRAYDALQAKVEDDECLEVEPNILKYIEKIIDLCDKYEVPVIFYRAPYRSTENELRKANYLERYFAEHNVPFYDLEKLIEFDDKKDFLDYEHLSEVGAQKATDFLNEKVLEYLQL